MDVLACVVLSERKLPLTVLVCVVPATVMAWSASAGNGRIHAVTAVLQQHSYG